MAARDYGNWFSSHVGPSINAVVYVASEDSSHTVGGPFSVLYTLDQYTLPGSSELPLVILPESRTDDATSIVQYLPSMTVLQEGKSLYYTIKSFKITNIKTENGPWNDIIFSPGYRAFIWTLFAVGIFLIVRTVIILGFLARSKKLKLELRTFVVTIALFSSICR
jgi:hypothetical protein